MEKHSKQAGVFIGEPTPIRNMFISSASWHTQGVSCGRCNYTPELHEKTCIKLGGLEKLNN